MATIVQVRFAEGGKLYHFDPMDLSVPDGAAVVVDTSRGAEYGIAVRGNHQIEDSRLAAKLRPVLRLATPQDELTRRNNEKRADEAFQVCRKRIEDRRLEMNLVSVECAFDMSKLLFYFTADGRVDFRELVRDLAGIFRTRIELRQIGVRDKARMTGGIGPCGRELCCCTYMREFHPVSINMAKDQGLSLNPTKISGLCGRLMCCLKHEQQAYLDLQKNSPRIGSLIETPDGKGKVIGSQLLRGKIRVHLEGVEEKPVRDYLCEECCKPGEGTAKRIATAPKQEYTSRAADFTPQLDRDSAYQERPSAHRENPPAYREGNPRRERQDRAGRPPKKQAAPRPRQLQNMTEEEAEEFQDAFQQRSNKHRRGRRGGQNRRGGNPKDRQ